MKKSAKIIVILCAVLILIVGCSFVANHFKDKTPENTTSTTEQSSTQKYAFYIDDYGIK